MPKPKTECINVAMTLNLDKLAPMCTVSINKYIVVGSGDAGAAKLNSGAQQLSTQLDANGWKQRKDYPTIS